MAVKKPNCLVAGAAGFLGSKLCDALLTQNCRVFALDDLTSGQRENLEPFFQNPDFSFFQADINKSLPQDLPQLDYIFHLAGVETHALEEREVSLNTLQTNALGTTNLLQRAQKDGAKFLFASSIEVYLGVLSSLNLDYYFGATPPEERRYSLAEAKRFGEALVWEYRKKHRLDARIVRLPEVYGPGMDLKSSGSLGRFLESVLKNESLTIFGDGLKKEYYTFISDVVYGIYKAAFAKKSTGKIYPICDLKPLTTLELAYLVQSVVTPKPTLIFKPPLKEVEVPEIKIIDGQVQKELGWEAKISLKEGIEKTLKALKEAPQPKVVLPSPKPRLAFPKLPKIKIPQLPQIPKLPKAPKLPPRYRLATLLSFALLAMTLFYPLLSFTLKGFWGYRNLTNAQSHLRSLEPEKASLASQRAATLFKEGEKNLGDLFWLATLLKLKNQTVQIQHLYSTASFAAQSLYNLSEGLSPFTILKGYDLTSSLPLETNDFQNLTAEISEAQKNLSLAEAELKQVEAQALPSFLQKRFTQEKEKLEKTKKNLEALKTASLLAPEALGFKTPKTYLLLLQNSNELRATGGFIGSYGQLTLDRGQISDLKIDDIYNIDGQLDLKEAQFEPPKPLADHLGITNWRIRDANWNVDFAESAKTIASFYQEASGVKVDGALAWDLFFVEDLLTLTGPIHLAQFNETVTSENLFERAEFRAEAGYEEGSAQKRNFLALLGEKLINELLHLSSEKFLSLTKIVEKNLSQKHLLFYLEEGGQALLLAEQDWDGRVKKSEGDFLMVGDSNVGATKANFYVRRNQKLEIKNVDRAGTMENTLTLTYIHTGTSNAWPGGPYKNYLRILVPKGSFLVRALQTAEGVESKGEEITEQIEVGEEAGKTVLATVFTLNAGQSLTLKFVYRLPEEIYQPLSSNSYPLLIQKQPGTRGDPFTLDFYIPFGRGVSPTPLGFEQLGDLLRLSTTLEKDLDLEIPLQ